MGKFKKNFSKKSSAPKSRKETRKQLRKAKKARKNDYYTNRNKIANPASKNQKAEAVAKKPKPQVPKEDPQILARNKEKNEQKKLERDMAKQRIEVLKKANMDEDKTIKMLEKQLHLKKIKNKAIPKSFKEDGLDYLLEVCDPENLKATIASEQQLNEFDEEEFDEDFALMTGKAIKRKQQESESEEGEELDMEESDQEEETSVNEEEEDIVEKSDSEASFTETDKSDDEDETESVKDTWEDIYGRTRGKDGSIITNNETKYVPPAIRAKMESERSEDDKNRREKLNRLQKQLKGHLNRLAESNMHNITSQIENLYMNNSRNDMNETLTNLIFESVLLEVIAPERLLLEHIFLVSLLHANVGTEVGAHFLQSSVRKFEELFQNCESENKQVENAANVIAQLYNFKVVDHKLLYEILDKLSGRFNESDVECILLVLKNVGFGLRKDDPLALKNLIVHLQKRANEISSEEKDNPRVKFMLDILLAIKNNNVTKIPNYDTTYSEHLKKLSKGLIRKGSYVTTLNVPLEDLLNADQRGKWWVVGSAWTGKSSENIEKQSVKSDCFSQKLLDLAKKQRMNTDTRKNIFCIMMSAEDYLDAFEKLVRLDLKNQQQREIIHVLLHCCLQEKKFNPYYAVLAQKFCDHDRKYQMTIKCSIWDKLKAITEISAVQVANLAKLLTHLFLEKGLPISTLKIVQFGELDKISLRFVRQILIGILLSEDEENCLEVFEKVSQSEKLKMFRESLRLFIRHFLLRNLKTDSVSEDQKKLLENRAKLVDKILCANEKKSKF